MSKIRVLSNTRMLHDTGAERRLFENLCIIFGRGNLPPPSPPDKPGAMWEWPKQDDPPRGA